MRFSTLVLPLLLAASLSACKRNQPPVQDAPKEVVATAAPVAPAPPAADAAPVPVAAAAPVKPFDLQSVPVTTKALPAFPYFNTPSELKPSDLITDKDIEFDRVSVLAGEELRPVEGRIMRRKFFLSDLKWSPLQAHRNYETALKALGATRVDKVSPADQKFKERNNSNDDLFRKMGGISSPDQPQDAEVPNFEQWLIRTPKTNIWLSFYIDRSEFGMLTVEEKAMQQSVTALPAADLSHALKQDGHVALYLNFDTDSHVIRAESLPAVDEVVKLMQSEPGLKLSVEGHTDASGDAVHNRKLSLARAQSVVQAVTGKNIAAARLSASGKGPDQPLADNATEAGKAKNRRVELVRV